MNMLVSFAPFIVFAVLIHLGQPVASLWGGVLVAIVLLLRETFVLGRSLKILEVGTALLFGVLAIYTTMTAKEWTIPGVRIVVDSGLLIIIIASLAIGVPFTLQYAKESAPQSVWSSPDFLAVNRRITLAWAAAFAVLVAADAVMIFAPAHHFLGVAATVVALVLAFKYTQQQTTQRPEIR